VAEVTEAPSGGSRKAVGDNNRGRRLLRAVGEVALLIWILGVFWYYHESQGFGELVLNLLRLAG
jgi:hypothetical protein